MLNLRLAYHRLSCSEKTLFKENSMKHIDIKRKYQKETEAVHDNLAYLMNRNIKTRVRKLHL